MKILSNEEVELECTNGYFDDIIGFKRTGFLQANEVASYYAAKSRTHGYVTPIFIFDSRDYVDKGSQKYKKGKWYQFVKEFDDSVGWTFGDEIQLDRDGNKVNGVIEYERTKDMIIGKPIVIYFMGCDDGSFLIRHESMEAALKWIDDLPCDTTEDLFYGVLRSMVDLTPIN